MEIIFSSKCHSTLCSWFYAFKFRKRIRVFKNVDDHNFITRWMVVAKGYKIVFKSHRFALMETTLGIEGGWKKFTGQLLRWARPTWLTNLTTLLAERPV